VALALLAACTHGGSRHTVAGKVTTSEAAVAKVTATATGATPTAGPVHLDADVARLPDGKGARIAIVVDDVGIADTYLPGYIGLPPAITLSIIPFAPHAVEDDRAIHAAGHEILLHIPLANRRGPTAPDRLSPTDGADTIDRFLSGAVARVPDAIGANNHEGPYGSSSTALMRPLLAALQRRGLFFMDSVTSQRTVGFAVSQELGMPPRVNNVFIDHFESDADSRRAVLELALDAAQDGGAIGIGHVFHPYLLHAVVALAPQLEAKGFVLTPLSQVTDRLAATGLDVGVRTQAPA
jgi:polysaccharide deacetylase 2 family uncharacterized protein YibQ